MSRLFPVCMFWMGGELSQIERACVTSVVSQGHQVTLYSYRQPTDLPRDIEWANAAEILPEKQFVLFHEKNPAALGSDLFRFKLMEAGKGLWLDTDVLLLRPLVRGPEDILFGWEDECTINGAVLYLRRGSELLKELLLFTADEFPIPPFFDEAYRNTLRSAAQNGQPVHVSRMPWGVWGPLALTYFAKMLGLHEQAKSSDHFYPIHWKDAHKLITAGHRVEEHFTERTVAVHLWNTKLKSPSPLRPEITSDSFKIEKGSFLHKFIE